MTVSQDRSSDTAVETLKLAPLVSLLVVARNEEAAVKNLLEDIIQQDYPRERIELLLIDSASEDTTRQIFEDFAYQQHDFARVLLRDNPRKTLPCGLNIALNIYSGDIFLRIDAHARIPQNFVRQSVAVLESGQSACGGTRPVVLQEPTPWRETLLLAETAAFGSSPAAYRRQTKAREVSSVFHGAYRREVFESVGLYDERLRRTEDNDMSYRIRKAGYSIILDPSITSEQLMRSSFSQMLQQKAANGYWIGRTVFVSPGCLGLHHLVPLIFVLALIVGLVLGVLQNWLPLAALVGLYAVVDILLSARSVVQAPRKHLSMVLLPFIFLCIHVAYGAGTLVGLLRGPFGLKAKE